MWAGFNSSLTREKAGYKPADINSPQTHREMRREVCFDANIFEGVP